jgi:L-alanine-DL-glutamate epimerase-like enolase superfamily enzyme
MKITKIKVSAVNIPTAKTYHVAVMGSIASTQSVIIEVHTDEGLVGIGESDPSLAFTGESQQTVMTMLKHHLGPAVLGMDPRRIEAIHARMDAVSVENPFAKAAIDLACHDLLGKALGVPVYQILGGLVRERVPIMWSLGSEPPELNVAEAVKKTEEGYRTIGLKLGVLPPDVDVSRVAQVRRAVGPEVQIRCDANQAWRAGTAIATIKRLEEHDVAMIEQPVPRWDLEGMAQIVRAVSVPVGADESLCDQRDALQLIQNQAADFYSIKTTKQGGLLKAKKIAALVQAASGRLFVNSMIEMGVSVMSGLHFAASTPGLFDIGHALTSVRRLKGDILKEPVVYDVTGNQIEVVVPQDRVGLGVALDGAKMARYGVGEFWIEA